MLYQIICKIVTFPNFVNWKCPLASHIRWSYVTMYFRKSLKYIGLRSLHQVLSSIIMLWIMIHAYMTSTIFDVFHNMQGCPIIDHLTCNTPNHHINTKNGIIMKKSLYSNLAWNKACLFCLVFTWLTTTLLDMFIIFKIYGVIEHNLVHHVFFFLVITKIGPYALVIGTPILGYHNNMQTIIKTLHDNPINIPKSSRAPNEVDAWWGLCVNSTIDPKQQFKNKWALILCRSLF